MYKMLFKPYHERLAEHYLSSATKILNPKIFQERKSSLMSFRGNDRYGDHKHFRDWLFSQGIAIAQENKKLYMLFFDEHRALMFTLKWGASC